MGFAEQNIYYTVWVGLGGAALTFLVVVPPWPLFNQSSESWLPPRHGLQDLNIEVDGQKVG